MSNSLNIDVLVSAKIEYTNQLVHLLSPHIYTIIKNIFNESQLKKKKREISLRNFQISLKQIPNWNTITIDNHINNIKQNIPYLLDLITAIFISHIKILASVRLKDTDKSVQVKVPNLDFFLHKIIITIAEKIYYDPHIILDSKKNIIIIIQDIIQDSIRNQIPLDKILNEYLEGVFNNETEVENAISLKAMESSQYGSIENNFNNNNNINNTMESRDNDSDDDESIESEESDHISVSNDEMKHIIPTRPIKNESTDISEIKNEEVKKPKILFSDAKLKAPIIKDNSDDNDENTDDDEEIDDDESVSDEN